MTLTELKQMFSDGVRVRMGPLSAPSLDYLGILLSSSEETVVVSPVYQGSRGIASKFISAEEKGDVVLVTVEDAVGQPAQFTFSTPASVPTALKWRMEGLLSA